MARLAVNRYGFAVVAPVFEDRPFGIGLLALLIGIGHLDVGTTPDGAGIRREISSNYRTSSRPGNIFLTTAIFVLGKAVPAIHRTVFSGFEGNFAFLFAIGTDSLVHLSGSSVKSSILKSHIISPRYRCAFAGIDFRLGKERGNHLTAYSRSLRL